MFQPSFPDERPPVPARLKCSRLFSLGVFALGLPAQGAAAQPLNPAPDFSSAPPPASIHDQRSVWFLQQRAFPLDDIPEGARLRAWQHLNQAKPPPPPPPGPDPISSDHWVNIGPAPLLQTSPDGDVSGRVTEIAVDPADPNRWLIGAAQGGIWETRDAGSTWIPKTDDQPSLAMGAITFAPSNPNIIYAGTGEGEFSYVSYAGAGLLKSIDGGAHWQLISSSQFAKACFGDLKVHPQNPDVLVAATVRGVAGRVAAGTNLPPTAPPRGVFRSTDGGVTWTQRLFGEATDLEVDPTDFNHQYAALGEIYGQVTNGVYRSLDAGQTWSQVAGPWPSNSRALGRIEMAIAPSNPKVLYVSIAKIRDASGAVLLGQWRTDNAWDTTPAWKSLPDTFAGYQLWYDHEIIVDPHDPNILYFGETYLQKFDGISWSSILGSIHVDQHRMAWTGNRLIVGNDGGVWSTTDGGMNWANHNTTLAITQFYNGSLHPANPNFALAGSQDNGTEIWTGSNAWQTVFGADGGDNAIASVNPDNNWAISYQRLSVLRTRDGGGSFTFVNSGLDTANALFIAPLAKSPASDDIFLAGTDNVWKCANFFSAASPSWFSNGPKLQAMEGTSAVPSSISAIAFAPSDPSGNTYACGTQHGLLRLTADGGTVWANLDFTNAVPDRYVTGLAFDPGDANVLYATLSGFDEGTPGQPGHVFKTTNALAVAPLWLNKSPPVNLPQNTIVIDPDHANIVYAGCDIGVWQSIDGGNSWTHMGPEIGMPNVAVFDIQINRATQRLVAFTHGRGAFALVPLNADTDGDGFSDLEELNAGTDPKDAASFLQIKQITFELGQPAIQFLASSNRTYSLQFKETLNLANWANLKNLDARMTNRFETVLDTHPSSSRRFYRLVTPKQESNP